MYQKLKTKNVTSDGLTLTEDNNVIFTPDWLLRLLYNNIFTQWLETLFCVKKAQNTICFDYRLITSDSAHWNLNTE